MVLDIAQFTNQEKWTKTYLLYLHYSNILIYSLIAYTCYHSNSYWQEKYVQFHYWLHLFINQSTTLIMIFISISSLYYGLLDLMDAISLLITFHSAIFSCEVTFALFITFHGNCWFIRKNLRSCQVARDPMARVDHFSASLRLKVTKGGIWFLHVDMTIMNAITVMNAIATNAISARMVKNKMITVSSLDYLVQRVNRIKNAFMNFRDSLIYLIIISKVIFCNYIFAF